MILIGLGNPGADYAHTRHNVGMMVLDAFAQSEHLKTRDTWGDWHSKVAVQTVQLNDTATPIRLLKAQSFMNVSGQPLGEYLRYFQLMQDDLLVIHDELDLPFGRWQLRFGGGAGGHHGVESLVEHLGTADFWRLRVGIGRPDTPQAAAEYVLAPFLAAEQTQLEKIIDDILSYLVESVATKPVPQTRTVIFE